MKTIKQINADILENLQSRLQPGGTLDAVLVEHNKAEVDKETRKLKVKYDRVKNEEEKKRLIDADLDAFKDDRESREKGYTKELIDIVQKSQTEGKPVKVEGIGEAAIGGAIETGLSGGSILGGIMGSIKGAFVSVLMTLRPVREFMATAGEYVGSWFSSDKSVDSWGKAREVALTKMAISDATESLKNSGKLTENEAAQLAQQMQREMLGDKKKEEPAATQQAAATTAETEKPAAMATGEAQAKPAAKDGSQDKEGEKSLTPQDAQAPPVLENAQTSMDSKMQQLKDYFLGDGQKIPVGISPHGLDNVASPPREIGTGRPLV